MKEGGVTLQFADSPKKWFNTLVITTRCRGRGTTKILLLMTVRLMGVAFRIRNYGVFRGP